MAISNRIRQRRKALGLSQEALAELAGIDQTQISRYEIGKNEPGSDALASLARALDTTTDWLVGLTGNPDRPLRGQTDLDDVEREAIKILRTKSPADRLKAVEVLRVL